MATVTDTVETEPGGRYGSIARDHRARREREADPQAGQGVRLAQRPDDDQAWVAGAEREEASSR